MLQRAGETLHRTRAAAAGQEGGEGGASRPGRYQQVQPQLEVKGIVVGTGEARQRYVLVRNPQQAERDRAHRERILDRLLEELEAIQCLSPAQQA